MDSPKDKPNEYWKDKLTPEQYHVTREKGTEAPFSGQYDTFFEDGRYKCVNCGADLFSSDTKYDSGCGWPAFTSPANATIVKELSDDSFGMHRVEVQCNNCGAHLGHVFPDGPKDKGGLRYCINSAALQFQKQ